jgi:hydrogenase maturation protein HypF
VHTDEAYPFRLEPGDGPLIVDWAPLVQEVLSDLGTGVANPLMAARFHNALAEMVVAVARHAGEAQVALSGGCFQNRYLTERTVRRLTAEGFSPHWHQRIPPNDGGIALGQILAAARSKE